MSCCWEKSRQFISRLWKRMRFSSPWRLWKGISNHTSSFLWTCRKNYILVWDWGGSRFPISLWLMFFLNYQDFLLKDGPPSLTMGACRVFEVNTSFGYFFFAFRRTILVIPYIRTPGGLFDSGSNISDFGIWCWCCSAWYVIVSLSRH